MNTTITSEPRSISGYEGLVDSTIRGTSALVFGGLLAGIGLFYSWVAWGDTPESIPRPNVSDNLFGAIAVGIFAIPGLFLLTMGIRDKFAEFRVAGIREQFPDESWRWDFPTAGHELLDIGLRQATKGLLAALMGTAIIGVMTAVIWTVDAPIFAKIGISLFIGLMLLSLGTVAYRIFIQVVHGRSRLRLADFPLRLGQAVELELIPKKPIDDLEDLHCTLRCVEEQFIATQTNNGGRRTRTTRLVARAMYVAEQTLPQESLRGGRAIRLAFELPDDPELRSRLSETPPLYWDLTCAGSRPGADFEKRFLLPVY